MVREEEQLIVPAFATRSLHIAGGPPMEQAVPQDYAMASMVMRAFEARNGRELEFVMKAYLPIRVREAAEENMFFLTETLGLVTNPLTSRTLPDFQATIIRLRGSSNKEDILGAIEDANKKLKDLSESRAVSFPGLCSSPLAMPISKLLDVPARSHLEPFAFVFPDVIDVSTISQNEGLFVQTANALFQAHEQLQELADALHERIRYVIGSGESAISPQRMKLEQRIDVLQKEITNLESRLQLLEQSDSADSSHKTELEQQLDARVAAFRRDEERLKSILSSHQDKSNILTEREAVLWKRVSEIRDILEVERHALMEFLIPGSGLIVKHKSAHLMIPFFIAGFSKKGRLSIEIYPPSRLVDDPASVGRLRDYVDAFFPASAGINNLAELLRDRADRDVNLRKIIRTTAAKLNLLSLNQVRPILSEGTNLLISDALVRKSLVSELNELLSGIPAQNLDTAHVKPLVVSKGVEDLCDVRFHIHDESGSPIVESVVELGALRLKSDSSGVVRASLPKSHYEATIHAAGYKTKHLEFALRTTDDIVIPVILQQLSKEERLDKELDALLERAKRIEQIRERLRDAFDKQGTTLLTIPAYRGALEDLLTELGYDSESWIAQASKKKGMVTRLLKKDDRVDGLRRDILQMAEDSKQAGGIMLFSELLVRLDNLGWTITSKETEDIIGAMTKEGLVEGISSLESGALLVKFIPVSLTDDPQQLLSLAARKAGRLTLEDAVVDLGWTEERVMNAIGLLVEKGVAKIQKSYSKSTQYWFPGLRRKK